MTATVRSGSDGLGADRAEPSELLRVGYLGGLGRSGTTLLARLLGELPEVCNVGELCHLWERGLAGNERCSCGEPFLFCPFWSRVGDVAFGGWTAVDLDHVRDLHAEIDRTRHVPRLATRVPPRLHHVLTEYVGLYERVYAAVREITGKPVVLDASKHGSLAFCLRWSARIDLRVIHCVRDSRAVANSWLQQVRRPEITGGDEYMPIYSPLRSAGFWNVDNGLFELLARRGTPTRLMRYEDFTAAPVPVLEDVTAFLGIAAPRSDLLRPDGVARLGAGHTVAGNPMRFDHGPIRIRTDERWRDQLPRGSRTLVSALTLPFRKRYGYTGRIRKDTTS